MTEVPTLGEMRQSLADPVPPTLGEMAHANLLYQMDRDAYLEHYGVKGMKWGVRRSREVLERLSGRAKKAAIGTKDEEGNVVGGIRAASRAGAQKLKDMREGSTLILEDANGAKKIMSKQKDGTFKEVYLSADAERVLRTSKKAESELSDAEITAAINRSKKIEEYNKLFNKVDPNADLRARAEAMDLEMKIKAAEAVLNPPKKKLVDKFIGTVSGSFGAYNRMDSAMNGKLTPLMKQMVSDVMEANSQNANTASKVGDAMAARRSKKSEAKAAEDRFWGGGDKLSDTTSSPRMGDMGVTPTQQRRVDDYVHNITTVGQNDPSNPFYNPTPSGTTIPPYYPELERKS